MRRRLAPLVLLLVAPSLHADPRPPTGFMVRAAIGLGYDAVRGDASPLEASGIGASGHLAVGWFIVPGLALHVTLWSGSTFNPSGTTAGGAASVYRDLSPAIVGRGGGITWVIPSLHSFVSASVGAASVDLQATVADIVVISRASLGVGVDVMVGRQFEVGAGWRFGVGAQGFYQRNAVTSRGTTDDVTSGGAALLATLTNH